LAACAAVAVYFLRNSGDGMVEPADRSAATAAPLSDVPSNTTAPSERALAQGKSAPASPESQREEEAPSAMPASAGPQHAALPARPASAASQEEAAEDANAKAPPKKAAVSGGSTKHPARATHATGPQAPPEPTHSGKSPLVVRPLADEWDRRIDDTKKAPQSVYMPAGNIDMNDFR